MSVYNLPNSMLFVWDFYTDWQGSLFDIAYQHKKVNPILFCDGTLQLDVGSCKKGKICEVCGKALASNSSYYVHMKKHSNNKPYKCSECDAAFCWKPYLTAHIRTHTGEKPFKCECCEKLFTQKSSLNIHMRKHTGERPYKCDICFKSFAVKSYVTSHRITHINKDPVPCLHCGLEFLNKHSYLYHMEEHKVKDFHCQSCGKSFNKANNLIKHNLLAHRGHLLESPLSD
ncbi:gastrula zinc finger protein XlCGF49.1-like isoform X1 [Cimex lectularius]|uniref:C2H2-type domain-containing protein n=1 Tax=Cimex lectularius TaxID=79782 RepID=A0A8I6S9Z7_CIMLE|nr:gastrula zinc finger protein XlCGF49.1-like isoform X1 [Cimex lectularius]